MPYKKPEERCFTSIHFNNCRCILYDFNTFNSIGIGYDKPLKYCDDYGGFNPEAWDKITPWGKEVINTCTSK